MPRQAVLSVAAASAVTLVVALSGALSAAYAQPVHLAAHRATYDLSLNNARGGDVTAVTGTMAYEVTDACDGWAVRQRLQMTLSNRDGQDVQMVSDYLTWESKDGTKLRFHMKQTTDTAVTEQVDGDASLASVGGEGTVHYTTPDDKTQPLPAGTVFPMAHTATIISAAQEGKKFIAVPLFDGTGDDGAQNTSIFVSSWTGPSAAPFPDLAPLPSGRVRVAFFSRKATEQSPDYEVGMRYWDNGVADGLDMDFIDFVVSGKLATFSMPPSHC